ncbi:MAG: DUF4157 domain-containing protein [Microscillaceae bacterium]|jgi:hypothetical protein|nr:DUF4157 domain-containing protein [Microscillaceae bacterium]
MKSNLENKQNATEQAKSNNNNIQTKLSNPFLGGQSQKTGNPFLPAQMKKSKNPFLKTADVSQAIQAKSVGDGDLMQKMGESMGADFSGVNIHANSEKASSVGALAYTQGNDIHFAPNQYNPNTQEGASLLGHELTHVVQQREGRVQANSSVNGMPLNDDAGLEREADAMGAKAADKAIQRKSEEEEELQA